MADVKTPQNGASTSFADLVSAPSKNQNQFLKFYYTLDSLDTEDELNKNNVSVDSGQERMKQEN